MYTAPIAPAATLVVGRLTMFLIGTELFLLAPLLPLLVADYRVSPTLAGWCVTAFSLSYMATAPLLGFVADRMGRRPLLVCSLLVLGAADLLTAIAPSLTWLIVARTFAGAAAAGVSPSIYAFVAAAAPPNGRAAWLAFSVSGLLTSLPLGVAVSAEVGATLGWGWVFVALATLNLLFARLNCCIW